MSKIKVKMVKCVPYQLCPKCNGEKFYTVSNLGLSTVSTTTCSCNICNGTGTVPMYVLPKKES